VIVWRSHVNASPTNWHERIGDEREYFSGSGRR
jgi:hypothetical protein